jgi:hypothetical protein
LRLSLPCAARSGSEPAASTSCAVPVWPIWTPAYSDGSISNINERWRIEFRAEAFNVTNTPHFANPGSNVGNFTPEATDPLRRYNGYGEITGVTNLGRDGIDERQFRFGLRIGF